MSYSLAQVLLIKKMLIDGRRPKSEVFLKLAETAESLMTKERWRKVSFCSVFVGALIKAKRRKKPIVLIRELGLNNREYARFNDLVRFGFAYRVPGSPNGTYGLFLEKIDDFFNGRVKVSSHFHQNTVSKDFILSPEEISIHEIPSVKEVMDLYGEKMTVYERI